jgi:guanyl-specific ribonuclease Sa
MARIAAAVKFALTSLLLAAAMTAPLAQARADRPTESNLAAIRVAELPTQGRETYELIRQGGPFPFGKDGAVFGNRERSLPAESAGITANTPWRRQVRATGGPGASYAAVRPGRHMPVITPLTTMAVFERLWSNPK